jgi:hypothetical protein
MNAEQVCSGEGEWALSQKWLFFYFFIFYFLSDIFNVVLDRSPRPTTSRDTRKLLT